MSTPHNATCHRSTHLKNTSQRNTIQCVAIQHARLHLYMHACTHTRRHAQKVRIEADTEITDTLFGGKTVPAASSFVIMSVCMTMIAVLSQVPSHAVFAGNSQQPALNFALAQAAPSQPEQAPLPQQPLLVPSQVPHGSTMSQFSPQFLSHEHHLLAKPPAHSILPRPSANRLADGFANRSAMASASKAVAAGKIRFAFPILDPTTGERILTKVYVRACASVFARVRACICAHMLD